MKKKEKHRINVNKNKQKETKTKKVTNLQIEFYNEKRMFYLKKNKKLDGK